MNEDGDNAISTGDITHYAAFAINDHGLKIRPRTDIEAGTVFPVTTRRVIANLLVAVNGATSLGGKSTPLSTPADRQKFLQLRSEAQAVIIGGATYRSEPYSSLPIKLYVSSTTLQSISTAGLLIAPEPPQEILYRAIQESGSPVLVEGGPKFLAPLINDALIDELHITRVPKTGDGDFFDEIALKERYQLTDEQQVAETIFQIWEPKVSRTQQSE